MTQADHNTEKKVPEGSTCSRISSHMYSAAKFTSVTEVSHGFNLTSYQQYTQNGNAKTVNQTALQ
jgi:hypothetical protein